MQFPHFIARLLLLACVTLAGGGCERGEDGTGQTDAVPEEAESLSSAVREHVDRILEASNAMTIPVTVRVDENTVVPSRTRKARDVPESASTWQRPEDMLVKTPGSVVADWPLDQAPKRILIDSEGGIICAGPERVTVFEGDSSQTILEEPANVLQWDPEGRRVLISSPRVKLVLSWPDQSVVNDLSENDLPGYALFSPNGEAFWFLEDWVDFDAARAVRIAWTVRETESEGAIPRDLLEYHPVAEVGTLPTVGITWGIPLEKYRIFPESGSLWELDENFISLRSLTDAGESVDVRPSADRSGRLCFLRAPRLVDGALTRTTRAWTTRVAGEADEKQMTAEPTYAVAVSPDGGMLAFVVERGGRAVLLRSAADDVLQNDLSDATRTGTRFETSVRALADDLRSAMTTLCPGGPPPITDDYAEQTPWPGMQLLDGMDSAFREAALKRAGLALDGSLASLAALDVFLSESDGLLPEENALILALGAYYGTVLTSSADARWLPDSYTPALGVDQSEVTETDDLMYTFHGVFYAARERLAGRVSLFATAVDLLETWKQPITLTENFSSNTRNLWFLARLQEAGFDLEKNPIDAFRAAVDAAPGNNVVNALALEAVRQVPDTSLHLAAALNLAHANPDSGRALITAAQALSRTGDTELHLLLCRQAELLAPEDPDILFDSATCHFDVWHLDEAEDLYKRARLLDKTGALSDLIAEHLHQLQGFRDEGLGK